MKWQRCNSLHSCNTRGKKKDNFIYMDVKRFGSFSPFELVACWPKELKTENRKDNFYLQFTNCSSNVAKTSSLETYPRNYMNSLAIKKFTSIEFGSKRSNTIFYSCHTKFYCCSAMYLPSFLF